MSKHLLRVALYLDLSEVVWNFCLPSFIKTVKAAGFKVGLFGEPYLCVAVLPLATLRLWALRLAYVCLYACLVSAVALVLRQGLAVFLAYCVVAAAAKFTQQAHSASCRLCTLGCVFGATSFVISFAAAVVMAAFVAVCPTYWLWWPTRLPESEVEQKLLDLEAWVIDNQDYLRSRNGVTLRAKLDQRERKHKFSEILLIGITIASGSLYVPRYGNASKFLFWRAAARKAVRMQTPRQSRGRRQSALKWSSTRALRHLLQRLAR